MFEINSYSGLALILAIVDMGVAIATLAVQGKVDANMVTVLWAIRGAIATVAFIFACYGILKKQNWQIAVIALTITALALALETLLLISIIFQLILGVLEWLSRLIIRPW
jgi:hypothetical protein